MNNLSIHHYLPLSIDNKFLAVQYLNQEPSDVNVYEYQSVDHLAQHLASHILTNPPLTPIHTTDTNSKSINGKLHDWFENFYQDEFKMQTSLYNLVTREEWYILKLLPDDLKMQVNRWIDKIKAESKYYLEMDPIGVNQILQYIPTGQHLYSFYIDSDLVGTYGIGDENETIQEALVTCGDGKIILDENEISGPNGRLIFKTKQMAHDIYKTISTG